MTKNLLQDKPPTGFAQWMKWDHSIKQTESGEIPCHYTQLSQLKNEISPEPSPQLELEEKVKMVSVSKEYNATIKTLFYTAGHFEFRNRWQEGVKQVDEVDHTLPGIGTRHRHVMNDGQTIMYTSSFSYDPENKIIFSETDEKKKTSTYFILEKTGDNKYRLTLEYYLEKNIITKLLFKLGMKKKMQTIFEKSLLNLDNLLKETPVPEF